MSIKNEISDVFATLSSEKEIKIFLNEIITALHDINSATIASLVKGGVLSEEQAKTKSEHTDMLLKQIVEAMCENIKIDNLNKKAKMVDLLKADNDNLTAKVERAKEMLAEKDIEIEKARKSTQNVLKKKLQIGRDKVMAIAETSTVLGEYVDTREAVDVLNNIRFNVGILTEEMVSLGLWDEDEVKPNVEPIVLNVSKTDKTTEGDVVPEKPKKKTTKKTSGKTTVAITKDETPEPPEDLVPADVPPVKKKTKKAPKEELQLSLLDVEDDL